MRFGPGDVFDSYYYATAEDTRSCASGVGVRPAPDAEDDVLRRSADIPPGAVVPDRGGPHPTEKGTPTRAGTGPLTAPRPGRQGAGKILKE